MSNLYLIFNPTSRYCQTLRYYCNLVIQMGRETLSSILVYNIIKTMIYWQRANRLAEYHTHSLSICTVHTLCCRILIELLNRLGIYCLTCSKLEVWDNFAIKHICLVDAKYVDRCNIWKCNTDGILTALITQSQYVKCSRYRARAQTAVSLSKLRI